MSTIPLLDLNAQYRSIKPEIDAAIRRVMDSGQFVLGPQVQALEEEIARYCGTRFAVAVASGTDALELALRGCKIGPNDEVLTSAFSFFASVEAILAVGAQPVFIDIDPATYNLDVALLQKHLSKRTKAILPVHLYGHPADMKSLMEFAASYRLKVIEDCAQAMGAAINGKRVGSFGDAGCLSFYPTKNLGCYGDGGMVVTHDASLAKEVFLLRAHGSRKRYRHLAIGRNSRLDELQAAILRVKLKRLDQWNKARRLRAALYTSLLQKNGLGQVRAPAERKNYHHVYHLYTIRTPNRRKVIDRLEKQGIATQVAYPSTLPSQPALKTKIRSQKGFVEAEKASRSVLSLPLYPELSAKQIEFVVQSLHVALSS
ncbi:MAG: DegT/DnrJ/EryC1/StrS family aminotransferase [Candidatus Omnitrophica bacterium]|nr:DegT/DnrJ/EryC1/StrS family aminotransferase [Candidatus Omnitrophota bacterium]